MYSARPYPKYYFYKENDLNSIHFSCKLPLESDFHLYLICKTSYYRGYYVASCLSHPENVLQ